MKNLKSKYIIKELFLFLEENKKLNIIKYSKKYQELFEINIDYYKDKSDKYIIGERNGKGKEYVKYLNKLLFEGEYLNGKRNGKGIEYDEYGHKKFEGLYFKGYLLEGKGYDFDGNIILNIEKNGKGKEYYYFNGNILFKGEYKNGIKWNGKGYDIFGKLQYELKNGNGYIKEYNFVGTELEYEGEYLNGKRNGKGKEYGYDDKLE